MYSAIFVCLTIFFTAVIATQLIRFSSVVIKLRKDKALLQQDVKEDKDWEFIKGLY